MVGGSRRPRSAADSAGPRDLPTLAPRGVGAILDTAFDVFRARGGTCLAFAVPLWIPAQLLGRRITGELMRAEAFGPLLAVTGLQMTASVVAQSLAVGLVCRVVYGELQGRDARPGEVLASVSRRAPALLAMTVAVAVTTAGGVMCCLLPGLVLSWLFMVAPAALVLEDLGPLQAIARSAQLMSKSFLRWLGVIATQWVLVLPLSLIAGVLAQPGANAAIEQRLHWPAGVYGAAAVLLGALITGLATAFSAVVMTVFYLDSRVRHEGFDLEMRFERLRDRRRSAGAAR